MGDSLLALAKSIYYELVLLDSLIKVKKKKKKKKETTRYRTYLRFTSEKGTIYSILSKNFYNRYLFYSFNF